jgi:NAD+ diphosphatase
LPGRGSTYDRRDFFRYTLAACFYWGSVISNGENIFAGAYVDRSGHLRKDPEWLENAVQSSDSLFAPVWRDKCLARGEPFRAVLLERDIVKDFLDQQEIIFLGMYRDKPAFAINVGHDDEAPFADAGEFHDLRYLGSVLPADDANLTAHARALVLWHRIQKFCGHCGSETRAQSGGNSRTCIAEDCNRQIFPRVDPAIIVLVVDRDRCLLGRQTGWPDDRYSTIAGFVEPGESLEDAVQREVFEETNIETSDVRYHSSQPWPFPSALMLGFTAAATSTDIQLNDEELEDAQWFSRKQLLSGFPKLPYRLSIARRLVDDWLHV